ncbi:hypothetical protein [Sphingomonas sp.]|uniref:hypothetical protein n=1 Tax=Sphingomonas sp. TaxID=28214 RepID=UPI001B1E2AC7|nr:hypothetical protein [Sphingomonas sp.]MBO9713059.1 hypothetical protein [Sphingomonas sp.]
MSNSTGDAWFVRRGRGLFTNIRPVRLQGWLLSFAFVSLVTALAVFAQKSPAHWPAWATLIATATILYTLACYRLSASADGSGAC